LNIYFNLYLVVVVFDTSGILPLQPTSIPRVFHNYTDILPL
jgi:hypothetical protein